MTIETLKSEAAKLSHLKKLELRRFLAELLLEEERENLLSEEEKAILLRRQDENKIWQGKNHSRLRSQGQTGKEVWPTIKVEIKLNCLLFSNPYIR